MSEMNFNEVTETIEKVDEPVVETANVEPVSEPVYGGVGTYQGILVEDNSSVAKYVAGGMIAGSAITAAAMKLAGAVKEKVRQKKADEPPVKVRKRWRWQRPLVREIVLVENGTPGNAEGSDKPEEGKE